MQRSTARVAVALGSGCLAVGALVCLVVSVLPTSVLVGRLVGALGDVRASPVTADVVAHVAERLRLLGVVLLGLAASWIALRASVADLVAATWTALSRPPRPVRVDMLVVIGLAIAALAMRLPFLGQPMRYDEAMTFTDFASRPLPVGLSYYPDPNNHLLNTLLVHAAYAMFGNQSWVIRLPALIAGTLIAPLTYVLGQVLYGRHAALFAASLATVSSYLIEYSTNARGYTLQTVCFLLLGWCVVVAAKRDESSTLFAAAFVAALGMFAVPTMLYGVAVAAVWFVILRRLAPHDQNLRHSHGAAAVAVFGALVVLVYAPVILVSGPEKLVANRYVVALGVSDLMRELPTSLARTWSDWNRDVPLLITGILGVGFVTQTLTDVRRRSAPFGLVAGLVCLGCVGVQRVAPFERVWLFLLPIYFIAASAGLATLARNRVAGIVGALAGSGCAAAIAMTTLTSGAIVASPETGTFPDAESVARALAARLQSGDAVVSEVPASGPQLEYYFLRAGLTIEPLRRSPDEARALYVVAPLAVEPRVAGWANPRTIEAFSSSRLLTLDRPAY